jgi:NTP pyrophosphatase (non-canonical NTP hydrolase)
MKADMDAVSYTVLGLIGEAGELANTYKKVMRDDNYIITPDRMERMAGEIGDVLWYAARLSDELGLNLNVIALDNLFKLKDRQKRGTLPGSGDTR